MSSAGNPVETGMLSGDLEILTLEQVLQIDRALAAIGSFGEVRLVKVRGRLRFIQQLESREFLPCNGSSEE